MGNLTTSFDARFVIRKNRQAACVNAVRAALRGTGIAPAAAAAPGAPVAHELSALFEAAGWTLTYDGNGDVTSARFKGEKLSGAEAFEAAAPYVEAGSYVDFWQEYADGPEDKPNTRWSFDGARMTWHDLMQREERAALKRLETELEAFNRENAHRRATVLPPLCSTCFREGRKPEPMEEKPHPRAVPGASVYYECPRDGNALIAPLPTQSVSVGLGAVEQATAPRKARAARAPTHRRALIAGGAAAAIVGFAWAVIADLVALPLPFFTAVLGAAVGFAVWRASDRTGGREFQKLAVGVSLAGVFASKFMFVFLGALSIAESLGPEVPPDRGVVLFAALYATVKNVWHLFGVTDLIWVGIAVWLAWRLAREREPSHAARDKR